MVFAGIMSAYFVPSSVLVRPEYFIVAGLAISGIVATGGAVLLVIKKQIFWLAVMASLALVSLAFQATLVEFTARDAMISLRYFIYAFAILAGASYAFVSENSYFTVLSIFLLLILSVLISFGQYYNIFEISNYMVPIYGESAITLTTGDYWRRIIGTLGNPNYWGLWLAICLQIVGYRILFKRKYFEIFLFLLLLISIVMTGSRTASIAALSALIFGSFLLARQSTYNRSSGKKNSNSFFAIIAVGLFIVSLVYTLQYFLSEYYADVGRFSAGNLSTLDMRFQHWKEFLSEMLNNPYQILVGRGPSKATEIGFSDNMYLLLLRDFGAFSVAAYFFLWRSIFRTIYMNLVNCDGNRSDRCSIAMLIFITVIIFDFAADAWFNVRLIIPVLFYVGYIVADVKKDSVDLELQ